MHLQIPALFVAWWLYSVGQHLLFVRCRPGVTEAELDAAGETLGVQLPPTLRVLYRFLNGQVSCVWRSNDCWPTTAQCKCPLTRLRTLSQLQGAALPSLCAEKPNVCRYRTWNWMLHWMLKTRHRCTAACCMALWGRTSSTTMW